MCFFLMEAERGEQLNRVDMDWAATVGNAQHPVLLNIGKIRCNCQMGMGRARHCSRSMTLSCCTLKLAQQHAPQVATGRQCSRIVCKSGLERKT